MKSTFASLQASRLLKFWGGFPSFFLLTIFLTKPAKQIAKIRDLHELGHKHVYFHLSNNLTYLKWFIFELSYFFWRVRQLPSYFRFQHRKQQCCQPWPSTISFVIIIIFFQKSTLTFLNLNIKMKKGLKTHIWGPNKKKEKSKQKHRSQVRELLTNTWFLGGDKPVQTQSQFEFFFFAFSSKSSSFRTWCSLRFVDQCHKTQEICIKQNSLFWWRTADRTYKEEIWRF